MRLGTGLGRALRRRVLLGLLELCFELRIEIVVGLRLGACQVSVVAWVEPDEIAGRKPGQDPESEPMPVRLFDPGVFRIGDVVG